MKRKLFSIATLWVCFLALPILTSCDNNKSYDHTPPTGQGSIIVDNNSGSDTEVYIDGKRLGVAEASRDTAFDLAPGRYRLVLTEVSGYRNYRDDIDVLENRLTLLDVMADYANASLYYVIIDFE